LKSAKPSRSLKPKQRLAKPAPDTEPPALSETPSLRDMLRYAEQRFEAAQLFFGHGTSNAYDEAAYLLLYALGLPPHELEPYLARKLDGVERAAALGLIERRISERVPAAYLTHEAWLCGHRFYVDERVIVPRSFIAELLEDGLAPWLPDARKIGRVLDLCTGSGCLAILAALAFPGAQVDATDISVAALEVARRNVDEYGLAPDVKLVKADLYGELDKRYDLIISNPPYVDAPSMRALPSEYRKEPKLALAAGKDGLDIVHRILREAERRLNPRGLLIVEIGHNRKQLEAHYPKLDFTWLEVAAGDEFVFMLEGAQLRDLAAAKPTH
jgi:ribosomal protein L3 glutamine methyltransferase